MNEKLEKFNKKKKVKEELDKKQNKDKNKK